ncbi:hypothetical protein VTP01DRAFT_2762 [Rhizomucor pusillus]|uniref:uncharacterized protein n=1 Tax=Rhizomucor pusillus TaxID=4840 RepID=UPI0037424AF6
MRKIGYSYSKSLACYPLRFFIITFFRFIFFFFSPLYQSLPLILSCARASSCYLYLFLSCVFHNLSVSLPLSIPLLDLIQLLG